MEEVTKICVECNTSKTPMWRSGPAGPKSLCNACGIRFRKKRIVVKPDKKKPTPTSSATSTSSTTLIGSKSKEVVVVDMKKKKKLRIKLMPLGKEVVLLQQRQRSPMKKVKRKKMENQDYEYRKFGEVEQAACLLMSLSYGSVFG